MENEILIRAKSELANKPKQLVDIDIWLFVAVNTARALIDSMNKNDLSNHTFGDCKSVSDMQRAFDKIQGIYGMKLRRNLTYNYLCSLTAFYADKVLTEDDCRLIKEYEKIDKYLVYEL